LDFNNFERIGREIGLGKNQVKIIKILSDSEKSADTLSVESGIPKVKIYTFLNELIGLNAIKKTNSFPSKYYFLSIEDTVQNILDKKFEEFIDKRAGILSFLENSEMKKITKSIFNENEYTKALIDVYSKNEPLSIISRLDSFPRFLCPKDRQNYLQHRKTIKKYRKKFTEHENSVDKTALYTVYSKCLRRKDQYAKQSAKQDFQIISLWFQKNLEKKS